MYVWVMRRVYGTNIHVEVQALIVLEILRYKAGQDDAHQKRYACRAMRRVYGTTMEVQA